jgi:hypothetical protein
MAYGSILSDSIVDSNGSVFSPSSSLFKNRLINGDMRIDQRNAGASVTPANAAVTYTVDRWAFYVNQASKLTAQRSTIAPVGFVNSLSATSSSAYSVLTGDAFFLYQPIEGLNTADFSFGTANASTVTLSFWVRSSLTGNFGGALQNSGSTRSYPFSYSISSANTWEKKTITISGDASGTWLTNNGIGLQIIFSLGAGSTFSGTAGAWAAGNLVQPTGSTSVVGTNGATFYITGVQLEKGSTATSFDYLDYGRSLAQCQRYYQTVEGVANTTGGTSNTTYSFLTQMRATPTIGTVVQNTGTGIAFANVNVGGTSGQKAIFQSGNSSANAYFYVPLSSEL